MSRVALILTGDVERAALPEALGRVFPDVEFAALPHAPGAESFTSEVVKLIDAARATSNVRKQVQRMLESLFPRKRREAFDHIVLIDDVELKNDDNPAEIAKLVREAMRRELAEKYPNRSDVAQLVREKCSFHLFRTMIESYFFGDTAALTRAGAARPALVVQHLDRERFQTTDDDYLALPDGVYRDRRGKLLIPHQHQEPKLRERHPKAYLRYLCDPSLSDPKAYRETHEGAAALRELAWRQVIETSVNRCPFLTALLDDLGEALNQPLAWIDPTRAAPETRLKPNGILRNI